MQKYNERMKKYHDSYNEIQRTYEEIQRTYKVIQRTCKETTVTPNRMKKDNERISRNTTNGIKKHNELIHKILLQRKRNDSVTCKQIHRIGNNRK